MTGYVGTVNAWHDGGAAKAVTSNYVAGDELGPYNANIMALNATFAATAAPTHYDIKVERSPNGSDWFPEEAINSVSSGEVDSNDGVWHPDPTDGNHSAIVSTRPGMAYRVSVKAADGTAPTALITASFTRE